MEEWTTAESYGLVDPGLRHFEPLITPSAWGAARVDLAKLTVRDLIAIRRRLKKLWDLFDHDDALTISYGNTESEYFVADWNRLELSHFLVWPRGVDLIFVHAVQARLCVHSAGVPSWITTLIRHASRRLHLELQEEVRKQYKDGRCLISARLRLPRNGTLASALDFVDAMAKGVTTPPEHQEPDTVWDLLQAEVTEALIGVSESRWFEAKREPYRLDDPVQHLELGKDVAAMANSGGGLIVIGYGTQNIDGHDTVRLLRPCPQRYLDAHRYRSVLAARLYPQPHDVRFKYCPVQADSGILSIRIPAQPVDNLPVLVKGMPAPRRNRVEGAYFGLFRRQFDRNVSIDPSTLHVNLNHLFR